MPGFRASRLSATMTTIPEVEINLPSTVERLVWFVDHWSPTTVRPEGLVEIEIPHGRYLYVLPLGRQARRLRGLHLRPRAASAPRRRRRACPTAVSRARRSPGGALTPS